KPERFKTEVEAVRKVIKPAMERETKLVGKREPPANGMGLMFMSSGMPTLEKFVDRRVQSINDQLAGKSQGKSITLGMFQPPPPPKKGEKPPRNPFGAGMLLSAAIMKADLNKDGKLTLEELLFSAGRLFQEMDVNKDNIVDGREVVEGINRLLAQPFGFG